MRNEAVLNDCKRKLNKNNSKHKQHQQRQHRLMRTISGHEFSIRRKRRVKSSAKCDNQIANDDALKLLYLVDERVRNIGCIYNLYYAISDVFFSLCILIFILKNLESFATT